MDSRPVQIQVVALGIHTDGCAEGGHGAQVIAFCIEILALLLQPVDVALLWPQIFLDEACKMDNILYFSQFYCLKNV